MKSLFIYCLIDALFVGMIHWGACMICKNACSIYEKVNGWGQRSSWGQMIGNVPHFSCWSVSKICYWTCPHLFISASIVFKPGTKDPSVIHVPDLSSCGWWGHLGVKWYAMHNFPLFFSWNLLFFCYFCINYVRTWNKWSLGNSRFELMRSKVI